MSVCLKDEIHVARKEHRCLFCGGKIKKGEKYRQFAYAYEGSIVDQKIHLGCAHVLCNCPDIDDGWQVDGVMEYVNDALRNAGIKPAGYVCDAVKQYIELEGIKFE